LYTITIFVNMFSLPEFYICDSLSWICCWNVSNIPWRRPFEGWNILERRVVLVNWWLINMWAHLSIFIWYNLMISLFLVGAGRCGATVIALAFSETLKQAQAKDNCGK
jgi:hypothetical protein